MNYKQMVLDLINDGSIPVDDNFIPKEFDFHTEKTQYYQSLNGDEIRIFPPWGGVIILTKFGGWGYDPAAFPD